jgi:hypothetical protein
VLATSGQVLVFRARDDPVICQGAWYGSIGVGGLLTVISVRLRVWPKSERRSARRGAAALGTAGASTVARGWAMGRTLVRDIRSVTVGTASTLLPCPAHGQFLTVVGAPPPPAIPALPSSP